MSNALSEEKRQQLIALGRLGWPLRRIEQETGVRRETASAYLKAAGGDGQRLPEGRRHWRATAKSSSEDAVVRYDSTGGLAGSETACQNLAPLN
jgi:hypothetical protein